MPSRPSADPGQASSWSALREPTDLTRVPDDGPIHVPARKARSARIIDQRVGRGSVVQEAVNEALPRFFSEAVDAEGIRAIGQPEVDVTAVPLEDGQDLEFTVETDVRPDIELPELEGIAVEVDEVKASDEDTRALHLLGRASAANPSSAPSENGDVLDDISAVIADGSTTSGLTYEVSPATCSMGRARSRFERPRHQDLHRPRSPVLTARARPRVHVTRAVAGPASPPSDETSPLASRSTPGRARADVATRRAGQEVRAGCPGP